MELQRHAELISLGLTIPTVVLAAMVVYLFFPVAITAWRNKSTEPQDLLILGITAGFIGQFLDNSYWTIPWTASYWELPTTSKLINVGVFFNIFFRQACGIFAAWCHLKAAKEAGSLRNKALITTVGVSIVLGCLYSLLLIIIPKLGVV